ncbi:MAG: PucR family transcriptional regulator ligand-binding domain-containing protein [Firmicutes bacterium]|nr:PucR family transcriptional regulator ligand-binding domain-containing protein [Bacillota bacterium]
MLVDLTVKEALGFSCLKQARLLSGQDGLDNVIRYVTVIDAPDAVEWLRGGEFVLTTAYSIKDDPDAQVRLVEALSRKKAACLGIKLRRFLDSLSNDAIAKADEEQLPIIQIPFELAWIDIINPILGDVMDRQTRVLQQSWEVHRRFLDSVLNGGSTTSVAVTLAELIRRPVLILDTNFKVLARAVPDLDATQNPEATEDIEAILAEKLNGPGMFKFIPFEGGQGAFLTEVRVKGDVYGYILVEEALADSPLVSGESPATGESAPAVQPATPLTQTDIIAIEQAATVTALEIIKQRATEEVERRYRFNFVDDLLQGNFETREAVIRRAKSLGWDFTPPHVLLILDIDNFEKYYLEHVDEFEKDIQRIKDRMLNIVSSREIEGAESFIVVDRSDSVAVLCPVKPGGAAEDAKGMAMMLGRTLKQKVCEKLKPLTVSVGIGRFYPDVLDLRRSYAEAREALLLGKRVWGGESVVHYDDLGVYRLLLKCADPNEVRVFVQEYLGRLVEYDKAHKTAMIKTLDAYLKANSCLADAAGSLFIHVNSLKYRLRQIQEILGVNLSDPEVVLNLRMAMKIRDIQTI